MSGYLVIAENVIFKNGKTTIINTYNELSAIAMPAEFRFDMAVFCGPKWSAGEHKLTIKVRANEGEELLLSESTVKIPNEDFVYTAVANDVKFRMSYDVQNLTLVVYDNDEEVISRKYPVVAMLVPQRKQPEEEMSTSNNSDENQNENNEG